MSNRPRPTIADYMVIALSPALIMVLIGSLVFFLIEVFYQGQFNSRLTFIMGLFVMAAVLIARISIEESRERAVLFAIPLALVTAIATYRFVEFSGPLQAFSPLINLGLIGLIWWCADKLTWDSTVIDESKDASGEGLLQTAGLDQDATTQNAAAGAAAPRETTQLTWWQRFVAYRRRQHAPGVWVIYFSLAALPVFGFGHWFIPSEDLDARRYVFQLLVAFVAAALGLLMTTSFLNLRRYLRQRRLEMPVEMAGTWLGVGAAMIVSLLLVCMLLPRRNPEYSVTQLPIFAGSPTDLWTTEYAVGNEGQEDPEKADRTSSQPPKGNGHQPGGEESGGKESGGKESGGKESGGKESGGKESGGKESGGKESGDKESGGKESGGKESRGKESRGKESGGKESGGKESGGKESGGKESGGKESGGKESGGKESRGKESGGKESGGKESGEKEKGGKESSGSESGDKEQGGSDSSSPQPVTKFDPSKVFSALGGTIGQLLKLLYWVIAVGIAAYFTWKYWLQIRAALANFWQSLRDFWGSLFGRKPTEFVEPAAGAEVAPPPKPFAAFQDPFLTGAAQRQPPVEVVQYSFSAFEAWAREQGCARVPEQTPQEFVQFVGQHQVAIARDAASLADLYNRCAYARELSPRMNIESLRRLWQAMRETVQIP